MNLPGLKIKPRKSTTPPDDYTKWGWYVMAALAVLWMLYSFLYHK
ncbi:hypothetical protein [Hymenobacter cavernae]|nr:hypothetical protein [Hymenobacter cavernae]